MANKLICIIEGCGNYREGKGLCKKHYTRLRRHGDPLHVSRTEYGVPLAWLQSYIGHQDKEQCLIWPYARTRAGYGNVSVDGHNTSASRLMCIYRNGEPPEEMNHAAHSCGKGHLGCVNPNHLRWANPEQNSQDKIKHGTSNRGERHGLSKLTADDVRSIRAMAKARTQKDIASVFGVTPKTVGQIIRRERWDWLE